MVTVVLLQSIKDSSAILIIIVGLQEAHLFERTSRRNQGSPTCCGQWGWAWQIGRMCTSKWGAKWRVAGRESRITRTSIRYYCQHCWYMILGQTLTIVQVSLRLRPKLSDVASILLAREVSTGSTATWTRSSESCCNFNLAPACHHGLCSPVSCTQARDLA